MTLWLANKVRCPTQKQKKEKRRGHVFSKLSPEGGETRPAFPPLNYTRMMRAGRLPNALKKTTWGLSQRMHISAGPERVPPCINTKLYFIFRSTFIIQVRSSTILLRVEKCGARVTVLSSLELKK
jgi:hypothetical protein